MRTIVAAIREIRPIPPRMYGDNSMTLSILITIYHTLADWRDFKDYAKICGSSFNVVAGLKNGERKVRAAQDTIVANGNRA